MAQRQGIASGGRQAVMLRRRQPPANDDNGFAPAGGALINFGAGVGTIVLKDAACPLVGPVVVPPLTR